jgi:hypothetical protein
MSRGNSEEIKREDIDSWCPRQDAQVLILSSTCFFPRKTKKICCGCTFDGNWPLVRIMLLLADMPESPGKKGKMLNWQGRHR